MQPASKDKAALFPYLRQCGLFASLPDETLAHFCEYASVRHEKKGTQLFAPDAPNESYFIIVSGWVKLFHETMSGEEAVIDILPGPNSFGEIGLAREDGMPYGAAVIEDAHIITLPRFLLAEEVRRNSIFGLAVLQNLTRQKIVRDLEIEHRSVQTAPQRIGCFLLKLCGQKTGGYVTLHLPYDKTVIACRLGMQPETFSRALSRLRDETGLKIRGASVDIPDVQTLVKYTCSACSSSYPCKH